MSALMILVWAVSHRAFTKTKVFGEAQKDFVNNSLVQVHGKRRGDFIGEL